MLRIAILALLYLIYSAFVWIHEDSQSTAEFVLDRRDRIALNFLDVDFETDGENLFKNNQLRIPLWEAIPEKVKIVQDNRSSASNWEFNGFSANGIGDYFTKAQEGGALNVGFNFKGELIFHQNGFHKSLQFSENAAFCLVQFSSCMDLKWEKTFLGSGNADLVGMEQDHANNIFLAGTYEGSLNFDPKSNLLMNANGGADIFVTKLDSLGNHQWSINLSSAGDEELSGIHLTNQGGVLITGKILGEMDFDPSTNVFNLGGYAEYNEFTASYSGDGQLQWAKVSAIKNSSPRTLLAQE